MHAFRSKKQKCRGLNFINDHKKKPGISKNVVKCHSNLPQKHNKGKLRHFNPLKQLYMGLVEFTPTMKSVAGFRGIIEHFQ